jgi:hypothetical protein
VIFSSSLVAISSTSSYHLSNIHMDDNTPNREFVKRVEPAGMGI